MSVIYVLDSAYSGDQFCFGSNPMATDRDQYCVPSVYDAMAKYNEGGVTNTSPGVDVNSNDTSQIAAALEQVEKRVHTYIYIYIIHM